MRKLVIALAALTLLLGACGSSHPGAVVQKTTTTIGSGPTTTADPSAPPGEFLVASEAVSPLQYSATAGGPPVGTLPTVTWGDPTVRPVVTVNGAWVEIQLDTRPNGSTAWVPRSGVNLALTGYRIVVSVSQRRLTLFRNGQQVYTSLVGVGAPQWATPMGVTFVDAIVATPKSQLYIYGPTVLILGTHSNVFTDFDGGDGTVAIHGYPSDPGSTDGAAVSHGCIRASPTTITSIQTVPLGSPVDVVA